jgi:hypothetical protein
VGSILADDVFPRGGLTWMGAYTPDRPTDHSYLPRGQGLPIRHRPVLSLLIGGGTYREEENSRGIVI